jgi:predicted RNA-binding protein YlxR (DUF448 family)
MNKRVPQRTCVACRQVKPKQKLIRLVRVPDGNVEVDVRGNKSGRGAYLCQMPECWRVGLKDGRLEYALRTTLTADSREQLIRYSKEFVKEPISDRDK